MYCACEIEIFFVVLNNVLGIIKISLFHNTRRYKEFYYKKQNNSG